MHPLPMRTSGPDPKYSGEKFPEEISFSETEVTSTRKEGITGSRKYKGGQERLW